jgi:hypothetical protein
MKIPYQVAIPAILLVASLAQSQDSKARVGVITKTFSPREHQRQPVRYRGIAGTLPAHFSIKQFTPTPDDQHKFNDGPAWAAAYGALTCLVAQKKGISGQEEVNKIAFSPSYVYAIADIGVDDECQNPLSVTDILNVLCQKGTVPLRVCPPGCQKRFVGTLPDTIGTTKLGSYVPICDASSPDRVGPVKASLAKGKPVVTALYMCETFEDAEEFWEPEDYEYRKPHGGGDTSQTLLVVGYDDGLRGGAFEVMNSWGTKKFGVEGYTWIRYNDFDRFAADTYELSLDPPAIPDNSIASIQTNPTPDPPPSHSSDQPATITNAEISGWVRLLDTHRQIMAIRNDGEMIRIMDQYPSGTYFQAELSTSGKAYVYALACDSLEQTARAAFSLESDTTQSSEARRIRIPSAVPTVFNCLEGPPGVDYYCVLISSTSLNLESITKEINLQSGSFTERIQSALHSDNLTGKGLSIEHGANVLFDTAERAGHVVPVVFAIRRGQ